MDEDQAELWRRHLANMVAIRGSLTLVGALLVALIVAVSVGAWAIVKAINETGF